VDTAIRIYIREELERAKLALAQVPEADYRAQTMRGLYQEAFQQLSSDRLLDAIISVRDLRESIGGLERPADTGPSAPGAPSTGPATELTDATTKRAKELGLPPGPSSGDTAP